MRFIDINDIRLKPINAFLEAVRRTRLRLLHPQRTKIVRNRVCVSIYYYNVFYKRARSTQGGRNIVIIKRIRRYLSIKSVGRLFKFEFFLLCIIISYKIVFLIFYEYFLFSNDFFIITNYFFIKCMSHQYIILYTIMTLYV